jgi:hypothetical protein
MPDDLNRLAIRVNTLELAMKKCGICLIGLLVFATAGDQLFAQTKKPDGRRSNKSVPAALGNPFHEAPDNHPIVQKVLVLNYDPFVSSAGGKRLHEVFGWNDPIKLAEEYKEATENASGGALKYEIVEWRNLNEIYAQRDGYRYTPDEYAANRRAGKGWHEGVGQDYPRLLHEQRVEPLIDAGVIDEVWIFSDHFFGLWEASMAGPGSFNINGGAYPEVATQRPFAFYGFSYERGVAEMMHDTCHRTEATLNRVYLGWNLKAPASNWDKFSANDKQSNGAAGVGTCHWPANANHDYDYSNPRVVQSWADDFLTYPRLSGKKTQVSCQTWADKGDFQRGYMKWYFAHLPRASGTNPDGRQNNWWKYMFDFENYDARGRPKPISARLDADDLFSLRQKAHRIRVAFSSPQHIDTGKLGDHDIKVSGPSGQPLEVHRVAVNDPRPGTRRVVTYEVAASGGTWQARDRGRYVVSLAAGGVRDLLGNLAPGGILGSFSVRSVAPEPLAVDPDTDLLLHGDGNTDDAARHQPVAAEDITYSDGLIEKALQFGRKGHLRFPKSVLPHPGEGTVEFWIKPDKDGKDYPDHCFFKAGNNFNNGILIGVDGARNLRLMQWGDDPETPAKETGVERGVATSAEAWKKGDWHHVAATWSSSTRELALYVDGRQVAFANNAIVLTDLSGTFVSIGADADKSAGAEACLDEFRVLHRARTGDEIRADYTLALGIRTLIFDQPDLTIGVEEHRPLAALASARTGTKRDVTKLVYWSSSDPQVATVVDGEVRGLKSGSATITGRLDTLVTEARVTVRDDIVPLAKVKLAPKVTAASGRYQFSVAYSAKPAVRARTLEYGNVRVVGPHGYSQFAQLQRVDIPKDGPTRVATYAIKPPGGTWNASGNGVYTIELERWQVSDTSGRYAPDQVLGRFEVDLGKGPDAR